jgi:hypothetical protein
MNEAIFVCQKKLFGFLNCNRLQGICFFRNQLTGTPFRLLCECFILNVEFCCINGEFGVPVRRVDMYMFKQLDLCLLGANMVPSMRSPRKRKLMNVHRNCGYNLFYEININIYTFICIQVIACLTEGYIWFF